MERLGMIFRWSAVCCFSLLLFGCNKEECFYDVSFGNKSSVNIYEAMIVTGVVKSQFGFLSDGGGVKTALGCGVVFTPDTFIEWEENDKPQRAKIDIMKYEKHKTTIRNFTFYYLGDGKWEIIAYKGEPGNRTVVKP